MELMNDVTNGQRPEMTYSNGRWTVSAWNAITTQVGATQEEAISSWNEFMQTLQECEKEEHGH